MAEEAIFADLALEETLGKLKQNMSRTRRRTDEKFGRALSISWTVPTQFEVNGTRVEFEDMADPSLLPVPGYPGWLRAFGWDSETGFTITSFFHTSTGSRPLRSFVSNQTNSPVSVKAMLRDGTVVPRDGQEVWPLDVRSGHGWTDALYQQALGMQGTGGHPTSNSILWQGPRFAAYTTSVGSANMNFYLPAEWWHRWFGKSPALAHFFTSYFEYTCRRPREWIEPVHGAPMGMHTVPQIENGRTNGAQPTWQGFSQNRKNLDGKNACDNQHADFLELWAGADIYDDPVFLELALKGWTILYRNGWELDPDYLLKQISSSQVNVLHSPRSFGWDLYNAGRALQKLSSIPGYEWWVDEIATRTEWLIDTLMDDAVFPERWVSPANWSLSYDIKQHGVPFSSDWQIAGPVAFGMQEFAAGATKAMKPVLATKALAHSERIMDHIDSFGWSRDWMTLYHVRTIDGHIKNPSGFPGIGNWGIAAGKRSEKQREYVDATFSRLHHYDGLNPFRERAVNNYAPVIEESLAASSKK